MKGKVNNDDYFTYKIEYNLNLIDLIPNKKIDLSFIGLPNDDEIKEQLILLKKIKEEDYYRIIIKSCKLKT